jgi:uncharacterized protein with FMN-binding domain
VVAGLGLGATTALTITAETASQLTGPGGLATSAGNLTGMVGTYLALMMVLLVSRIIKRAPLLVLGGPVAGFVGVLGFHNRPAPLITPQTVGGHPGGPSVAASQVAPAAGGAVRSAVGATENFGYGVLDVQVTVRGARVTDVSAPGLQVAEPRSQLICEQAIPVLRSEALSAQSTRIDGVSGATYTSEACALSLQAALDELHVK